MVSLHRLVGEAVGAALVSRGLEAVVLRWPVGNVTELPSAAPPRGPWGPPPDVGLLLGDLDRTDVVRGARSVLRGLDVPWLVLTHAPPGPAWGALYEAGAALVSSPDVALLDLAELVTTVVEGEATPPGATDVDAMIASWRRFIRRREDLLSRLARLSVRERAVLEQLHDGLTVPVIADAGGVAPSTVRTQVKAILRKLGVTTQIAAVALYEEVQADLAFSGRTEGPAV